MTLTFRTERLDVRDFCRADAAAVFAMYGNEEVRRFLPGLPRPPDVAQQRVELDRVVRKYAALVGRGVWAVQERSSGRVVGTALLKPPPRSDGRPSDVDEVGWHLAREAWGQGFAAEMARGLVCHAFEALRLERVIALIDPRNERSRAVATRAGFTLSGETSDYYGLAVEQWQLTADQKISPAPT